MAKKSGMLAVGVIAAAGLGAYMLLKKASGQTLPPYGRGDVLMTFIPVINVQAYTTIIETFLEQNGTWTVYAKAGMYPDYDPPDCMHGSLTSLLSEGWVFYQHIELPDTEHCPILP
jgi:hypothetical protein